MAQQNGRQQHQEVTSTTIDPDDFVSGIDNPYFPLEPGTTLVYESPDGTTFETFVITDKTVKILGVTCVVVEHTAIVDGQVVEYTLDYFAQDVDGNVWYFGESVKNYEDGHLVDRDGSWKAGVDGAEPGILMEASPQVGDVYQQENYPGVAEDMAEVISLDASVDVPYGSFDGVLQTDDFTPLEPGIIEQKYYVEGVGNVLVVNETTGEQELLVKIVIDGSSHDDTLVGKIGADELNGHAGDDELDGAAGNDTIDGGQGSDTLAGGSGDDAFDWNKQNESGTTASGRDVVTDFEGAGAAGGDVIDVSDIAAAVGAFTFIGTGTFTGTGEVRAVDNGSNTGSILEFNTAGNENPEMTIEVLGVDESAWTSDDFVF
jgi:hypothetical protein